MIGLPSSEYLLLAVGTRGGDLAAWEASIEKYKGQEAGMGHKGWAQSWAHHERSIGLKPKWQRNPAPVQQVPVHTEYAYP